MDAPNSALDATEVHFVVDSITAAFVQQSSDFSTQAWLLNHRMQEVLINGVSVKDASLDGLVPKELLQRLVGAADITLQRMSEALAASMKSLKKYAREAAAAPISPSVHANAQDLAEDERAPEDAHSPTEGQFGDDEPAASKPPRKCPAQEKLEKEIANYSAEIETYSNSGQEHALRVVELKKLLAFSEDQLKRLQTPLRPGKHHRCANCGKQFKTGIRLRMHQRRRHGGRLERSFAYDECNKVFTLTCHLARHKLIHSGVKPFECECCNKSFARSDYLRAQLCASEARKAPQMRKARQACNEIFTRETNLTRHLLTHTGAKPFECDTCHKCFARKDKLRIHQMVHSAERSYACAECGYRYATMMSLDQHRRIHRSAQCDKALK